MIYLTAPDSMRHRTAVTSYVSLNILWRKCLWYRPNYSHTLV